MRIVLNIVAVAVVVLAVLFALRWYGLVSHDAAVVGFVTGLVVAVVTALASKQKGSTG